LRLIFFCNNYPHMRIVVNLMIPAKHILLSGADYYRFRIAAGMALFPGPEAVRVASGMVESSKRH